MFGTRNKHGQLICINCERDGILSCDVCKPAQDFDADHFSIEKTDHVGLRRFFYHFYLICQDLSSNKDKISKEMCRHLPDIKLDLEDEMEKWGPALGTTKVAITARLYGQVTEVFIPEIIFGNGIFRGLVLFDKKRGTPYEENTWEGAIGHWEFERKTALHDIEEHKKSMCSTDNNDIIYEFWKASHLYEKFTEIEGHLRLLKMYSRIY